MLQDTGGGFSQWSHRWSGETTYSSLTGTRVRPYLIVAGQEGELLGLQELCLGDVQAIFPIEELYHAAVAVTDCQIILDDQPLQVLDDTPVKKHPAQYPWSRHPQGVPRGTGDRQ